MNLNYQLTLLNLQRTVVRLIYSLENFYILQLFSVIVFGCISSKGWMVDTESGKEVCLYNRDTNACNYGVGISVIAFLASIGFIVGEVMFDQMSSVKTRKHYVLGDLGFSGNVYYSFFFNFYMYNIYKTIHNLTIYCFVFQLFGHFCILLVFAILLMLGENLRILPRELV